MPGAVGAAVSDSRRVAITPTDTQVAVAVREASRDRGLAGAVAALGEFRDVQTAMLQLLDDTTYSHSACRAILTFAAFPADGSERNFLDIARDLEWSRSTTHRYLRTLVALGLLQQSPHITEVLPPAGLPTVAEGEQAMTSHTGQRMTVGSADLLNPPPTSVVSAAGECL